MYKWLCSIFACIILLLLAISQYVLYRWEQYMLILPPSEVEWWMVLGASVKHDGQLSPLLQQRVDQGFNAFQAHGIKRLLVSGYDAGPEYQEATSMAWYLLNRDFPDTALVIDGLWLDTYDSLWRAKYVHNISSLIIFTQAFHLPRSLYIARRLWIEAWWVPVDQGVQPIDHNSLREFFARIKAFLEIEIRI
jgi:SanA protein